MTLNISIDISAPPDIVWRVMSDVERWHEWTASVKGIRRFDKGEFRVGSRALVRQPKFPPALWTVTSIEPGREFVWKNVAPGILVVAHHSVAPVAGGSRASLGIAFQGLFGPTLGKLTAGITKRYLAMEAAGLKRRSEALAQGQRR